jgi:formate dehydrogenase subunit delta
MSSEKIEKLVRMANQIGDFFAAMPEAAATEGTANHIRRYWTPKMIREIVDHAAEGREDLNATAARAVAALGKETRD